MVSTVLIKCDFRLESSGSDSINLISSASISSLLVNLGDFIAINVITFAAFTNNQLHTPLSMVALNSTEGVKPKIIAHNIFSLSNDFFRVINHYQPFSIQSQIISVFRHRHVCKICSSTESSLAKPNEEIAWQFISSASMAQPLT